jgi:hypothetical protein
VKLNIQFSKKESSDKFTKGETGDPKEVASGIKGVGVLV